MGIDVRRVAYLFADGGHAKRVGSAYRTSHTRLITAAHLLTDCGLGVGDSVIVRPFAGSTRQISASVDLLSKGDLAVLLLHEPTLWDGSRNGAPWARLPHALPLQAAAIGYPVAAARPDGTRVSEHVIGVLTPPADPVTGLVAFNPRTASPGFPTEGGSAWAGMSGAAVIAGGAVVGIVVADALRFRHRLMVSPLESAADEPGFRDALGIEVSPEQMSEDRESGSDFSLQDVTPLHLPYEPLPLGYDLRADPHQMLDPRRRLVHVPLRADLADQIRAWASQSSQPLSFMTLSGSGGIGKTRLAAEACDALVRQGWRAGFITLDSDRPPPRCKIVQPTLLVVDDADINFRPAAAVAQSLAANPGVPVRMLLVSRNRGVWWESFHQATGHIARGLDGGDIALDQHPLTEIERHHMYRAAVETFTLFLGAGDTLSITDIESAAVAFLRKIPDLGDSNEEHLRSISEWLHEIHLGVGYGDDYWNPLRPAPLCDQMLADLDILPDLAVALMTVAARQDCPNPRAADRLLTELRRAAEAVGSSAQEALRAVLDAPSPQSAGG